jgi:hypothetical protein
VTAGALVLRLRRLLQRLRAEGGRVLRKVARRMRGWRSRTRVAVARGRDTVRLAGRTVARIRKQARRVRELEWDPYLEQRAIYRELAAVGRERAPVLVGPWLSEVGYEVLYWRPFLAWALDRFRIDPARLVAVSRGGPASWYEGLAGQYVDLLDLYTPDDFAARNAARRAGGDQKQLTPGAFDHEIAERVGEKLGEPIGRFLHPSLMFRLFRSYWFGNRPLDFLFRHARFAPPPPGPPVEGLPRSYTAVKFYTGAALPDTPEQRARLRAIVEELARVRPLVVLDTGLALDEHEDFLFGGLANVHPLGGRMTPATNLDVQARALAHAELFVGTCGGLVWLAPMLGVPTVGVYEDDRFLLPHLFTARYVFRRMGAAPFMPIEAGALDAVGWFARAAPGMGPASAGTPVQ